MPISVDDEIITCLNYYGIIMENGFASIKLLTHIIKTALRSYAWLFLSNLTGSH